MPAGGHVFPQTKTVIYGENAVYSPVRLLVRSCRCCLQRSKFSDRLRRQPRGVAKRGGMMAEQIVHALSIRQPYVELILRGEKLREYRSLGTKITGRVYLYASQVPADDPAAWARAGRDPGTLPSGLIVGSVEIVDCRWDGRTHCW